MIQQNKNVLQNNNNKKNHTHQIEMSLNSSEEDSHHLSKLQEQNREEYEDAAEEVEVFEFNSVCNFQSMKSPVELNSLFSKFFCYTTWFVISPD